jgi:hypothetical protein
MQTAGAEPHLAAPDAATLAGLREALLRSEYDEQRIAAALGPRPPFARTRRQVYRRRLAAARPSAVTSVPSACSSSVVYL